MRLFTATVSCLVLVCAGCPASDDGGSGGTMADTGGDGNTTQGDTGSGASGSSLGVDDSSGMAECENLGMGGTFSGSLAIESASDPNIAMLEGMSAMTGELQIDGTDLTNLDFLVCMQDIGSHLTVFGNSSLVDIEGLKNITDVGGNLVISENTSLTDMDSLNELKQVPDSMSISQNENMTAISGLSSLAVVQVNLTVQNNPVLTDISGLNNLEVVVFEFQVTQNPMLCTSQVINIGEGLDPQPMGGSQAGNADC